MKCFDAPEPAVLLATTISVEGCVMTKLQKDHLMLLLESIDSEVQITMESVSRVSRSDLS